MWHQLETTWRDQGRLLSCASVRWCPSPRNRGQSHEGMLSSPWPAWLVKRSHPRHQPGETSPACSRRDTSERQTQNHRVLKAPLNTSLSVLSPHFCSLLHVQLARTSSFLLSYLSFTRLASYTGIWAFCTHHLEEGILGGSAYVAQVPLLKISSSAQLLKVQGPPSASASRPFLPATNTVSQSQGTQELIANSMISCMCNCLH